MSHTFYDSPDFAPHPHISIDVTHDYVWFFQHTRRDGTELENIESCIVPREQLPEIYKAMGEYLADLP